MASLKSSFNLIVSSFYVHLPIMYFPLTGVGRYLNFGVYLLSVKFVLALKSDEITS